MDGQKFKVLITASGLGSRLGKLSKYLPKALVRVGNKAAITHIMDYYPKETQFVVTLGYQGHKIKEFLSYFDYDVTFVDVDQYEGPGSSQLYSMLCAKAHLQCPFIFHPIDTLVLEDTIPHVDYNWVACGPKRNSYDYATLQVNANHLLNIFPKGSEEEFHYTHIGLIGIRDYKEFWKEAEFCLDLTKAPSDVPVVHQLLRKGTIFKAIKVDTWYDTGNLDSYLQATKELAKDLTVLSKPGQEVYLYDKLVIKFFDDVDSVISRQKRAIALSKMVPEIVKPFSCKHF